MPKKKAEPEIQENIISENVKNNHLFHSTMMLGVLSNSLQEQKGNMLTAQGNGKLKNNKFNDGYMTALDDMRIVINDIINANVQTIKEENQEKEETVENTN